MDEDTQDLLTADFEIGHYIRERVVPRYSTLGYYRLIEIVTLLRNFLEPWHACNLEKKLKFQDFHSLPIC